MKKDKCRLCEKGFRRGEHEITLSYCYVKYAAGFEWILYFLGEYHIRCGIKLGLVEWTKRKNSPIANERIQLARPYTFKWAEKEFKLKSRVNKIKRMKISPREKGNRIFETEVEYAMFLNRAFDFNRRCMNCGTHIQRGDEIFLIQMWLANRNTHPPGDFQTLEVLCMPCARKIRRDWIKHIPQPVPKSLRKRKRAIVAVPGWILRSSI